MPLIQYHELKIIFLEVLIMFLYDVVVGDEQDGGFDGGVYQLRETLLELGFVAGH